MCFASGACTCEVPCEHCTCQKQSRLVCEVCDIWIPCREDAIASDVDWGICPRKEWPHNRTLSTDSCDHGVWPPEAVQ